jgi:hypothetical protein
MDRCVDLDVLAQALDLLRCRDSPPSLNQLIVLLEGLGGLYSSIDPSDKVQGEVITPTRVHTRGGTEDDHRESSAGRRVNDGDDSPSSSISSTLPSPWVGEPIDHDDVDQKIRVEGLENDQGHPTTPDRYTSAGEESTTFFFKAPQKPAFGTAYFAQKDEKPEIIFGVQNINLSGGPNDAPSSTSAGAFHIGSVDTATKAGRSVGIHGSGKQKRSPLKGKKRAVFATPIRSQELNRGGAQAAEGADTGVPMEESPVLGSNIDVGKPFGNSPLSSTTGFFENQQSFSSSTDYIDASGGENVIRNMASMNLQSSSSSVEPPPPPPPSFAFGATSAMFPASSSASNAAPASAAASQPPPFGVFAFGNSAAANQNRAPSNSLDNSINDVATAFSGFSFTTAAVTSDNPPPAVTFSLGVGDKDKSSSKKPSSAAGRRKQVPRGRPAASNQAPSGGSGNGNATKPDENEEAEFVASGVTGSVRSERDSAPTADHVENDKRMIEFAELMKNHGVTAYNENDYER